MWFRSITGILKNLSIFEIIFKKLSILGISTESWVRTWVVLSNIYKIFQKTWAFLRFTFSINYILLLKLNDFVCLFVCAELIEELARATDLKFGMRVEDVMARNKF